MTRLAGRLDAIGALNRAHLQGETEARKARSAALRKVEAALLVEAKTWRFDWSSTTGPKHALVEAFGLAPAAGALPELSHLSLETAHEEFEHLQATCSTQVDALVAAKAAECRLSARKQAKLERTGAAVTVPPQLWVALDRMHAIAVASQRIQHAWVEQQMVDVRAAAHAEDRVKAEERFAVHRAEVGALIDELELDIEGLGSAGWAWDRPDWDVVAPATDVRRHLRVGVLRPQLPSWIGDLAVPAIVAFPDHQGLLISHNGPARNQAMDLARNLIMRLLGAVPPGSARFTFIDPVGIGQSVAEFLHLSDFDPRLVDTKPWTSEREIEQRLDELAGHIETVISKYLRGQFDSIDAYNAVADEVAEPYRFLVVFDFPAHLSARASQQLLSIIENGPRTGVHTILVAPDDAEMSHGGVELARLAAAMQRVRVGSTVGGVLARLTIEPRGKEFAYEVGPDAAPHIGFDADGTPTSQAARLLVDIGAAARTVDAGPVTLDRVVRVLNRLLAAGRSAAAPELKPAPEHPPLDLAEPSTWWNGTTAGRAVAPIGRAGAQDLASIVFSSTDVAGGAIVVGLPRSGKSTALHAAITTMATIYGPEELELYLIDAKHGVEFKVYESLPHARMVSINSEREFAVAVLRSLDREIERRAQLMKERTAGRANLTAYRAATGDVLPRIVLFWDEFHEAFADDDDLGRAAFEAFSSIVRQGPFAGVHLVLSSQTMTSMPALDRSTLLLLPERVAFMSNESDAEIVMGEGARDVRGLSRPGEGLFNPARGEPAHHKPFQGTLLDPDERDDLIARIRAKADAEGWARTPRVFDGDAPGARPQSQSAPGERRVAIELGEPFTLDPSAGVVLRRTDGANLLISGDTADEEGADGAAIGALHSAIAGATAGGVPVDVIDVADADAPEGSLALHEVCAALGASHWPQRALPKLVAELLELTHQRIALDSFREPARLLIVTGLVRAKLLEADAEPEYDDDGNRAVTLADQFSELLRNGPEVGVHCVVVAESAAALERRLGRGALDAFAFRSLASTTAALDLQAFADSHRAVPVRRSQLVLVDADRGTRQTLRGYGPFSPGDLAARTSPTVPSPGGPPDE